MGIPGRGRRARAAQGAAGVRIRASGATELQIVMNLHLRIWRQLKSTTPGEFKDYQVKEIAPDLSFLEMLDALNEDLIARGEPPVAFEHDCREGICGSCGFLVNGVAHGGQRGTTVCQLSMRFFKNKDGETLTLEPWRARALSDCTRSDGESVSLRPHH